MNKKGIFIELIVIIGLVIVGFFWFTNSSGLNNGLKENETIKDSLEGKLVDYMEDSCVPITCCHATSCVNENQAPNCSKIDCTMDCQDETMDCGQGKCIWEDGNCEVEWNEI